MLTLIREISPLATSLETCGRVAAGLARLVGAEKACVCLWDADLRRLTGVAPGFGLADELVASLSFGSGESSLAVRAFRAGRVLVSNEVRGDPGILPRLTREFGLARNALAAPFATEDGPSGVVIVLDKARPFDSEDEEAASAVAAQAALLLRNARQHEALVGSRDRYRDAWRSRNRFLRDVDHELRTPLTAILGWSEVLSEDRPDELMAAHAAEQIRRSSQVLNGLLSDLLDLSRLEEGGARLERVDTDLGRLARESVEAVADSVAARGIVVSTTAPPDGAGASVDPLRARQVLRNLVLGLAKLTSKGGRIEVQTWPEGEGAVLRVSAEDAFVGPEDLSPSFEPLARSSLVSTRERGGGAIGIAMARAFVRMQGGTISADAGTAGTGVVFTVRIPAAAARPADPPRP